MTPAMLAALALAFPAPSPAQAGEPGGPSQPAPSQSAIDAALDRGVASLRGDLERELDDLRRSGPLRAVVASSPPGERALVAYALLEAAADRSSCEDLVSRVVASLSFESIQHTYGVSCTLLLLAEHDARAHRVWIAELAGQLLEWQSDGCWGYPASADLSNTQYAALGLWAAARAGIEIPAQAWDALARAVLLFQESRGGFCYQAHGQQATGSMTAAGIGTLALCEMELARQEALDPELSLAITTARQRAVGWLAGEFAVDRNPGSDAWVYYWLYGLERLASFSGLARIGTHDWYAEGARWLLGQQGAEGNWGGRWDTSFALLFLSRAALAMVAPRSGPEAYGRARAAEAASIELEARVEGDRVALRITRLAAHALAALEWPGDRGLGPRILRVQYLEGTRCLAAALGDRALPARGRTFPASARLPAGRHRLRARIHVLEPDGEATLALESPEVELDVPPAAAWPAPEPDPFAANLLGPRPAARVRASTTLRAIDFLPGVEFTPGRAIDGKLRSPWVAKETDEAPEWQITLERSLRADTVLLAPARLAGFPPDELGRALEVEVEVNGAPRGVVAFSPDPNRVARFALGAPVEVKSLRLVLRARVPGRRTAAVGLGEVGLALEATAAPAQAASPELLAKLEQAVDRPTAAERQEAARTLAALDVPLEDWLAAARAFGRFEAAESGVRREEVRLEGAGEAPVELVLYVPAGLDATRPAPLLVALHGTGGNGAGALSPWRFLADRMGMLVVAPSDPGTNAGATYSDAERAAVLGAVRWMRRHFDVDETRIHLTGVSRGGHLAWDLALRRPDLFASLAPMVGGPRVENGEGRNNLRYLENLAASTIVDLQGSGDDPMLLSNLRLAFARLSSWKAADARLVEFPDLGHDVDRSAVDWAELFGRARRDPRPERVVRLAARPGEGRAAWVEVLATGPDVQETFEPRVNPTRWNRLSPVERSEVFQELVDEKTARLEAVRKDRGSFRVTTRGVTGFRLLLGDEDLPEKGDLRLRVDFKERRLPVSRDAAVLLREFVERFDRTFLPVAEVRWP